MIIKSSFSKQMLFSTVFFCTFLGIALGYMVWQLTDNHINPTTQVIIYVAFLVVCFAIIYSFCSQIRAVQVNEEALIVKKMCGNITIPYAEMTEIGRKQSILHDIRLFGIGGLFGYIGLFKGNDIGKYKAYVNNGNNALYIKMNNEKCYVISCDQADFLVQELQAHLQQNI